MNPEHTALAEAEPDLDAIIADYLSSEFDGTTRPRRELFTRFPQFAEQLRQFFADHDRIRNIVNAPQLLQERNDRRPNADVPDPHRFGDYELLEEVGRGGMGVVYRARQISLNRIVALKMVLSGRFAAPEDVARLWREAEAAANLDHSSIVPIFESGRHAGQYFFSMAFVEGRDLAGRLSEGPLRSREAAGLTKLIAEAVHYANERGVIHRDLKPANILLDEHGIPKITDFGLAKVLGQESDLTLSGEIVGTAGYMAPEQAVGESIDRATNVDVYSLGAVLYALLTGRPPFLAPTAMETLLLVRDQEPLPPRQFDPRLSQDLETICLKCLQKDPAKRYATAGEMADDLQRFLEGRPILARPLNNLARSMRWCRRNPLPSALGVLLVTALLSGTIVSAFFAFSASRQTDVAIAASEAAEQSRQKFANLYHSARVDQARALLLSTQPGRRFNAMDAIKDAAAVRTSSELLDVAIASTKVTDLRIADWHPTVPAGTCGVAFDRTFSRCAAVDGEGNVTVRSFVDQQQETDLSAGGTGDWRLRFSPTGRFLAAYDRVSRSGVVWNPADGTTVLQVSSVCDFVSSNAFSPLDEWIAIGHTDPPQIVLYELETGYVHDSFPIDKPPSAIGFDPTGQYLAVCRAGGMKHGLLDLQTRRLTLSWTHPAPRVVAWSATRRFLAVAGDHREVHIWNTETNQRITYDASAAVELLQFSHDGNILAASGTRQTQLVNPRTGSPQVRCFHSSATLQFRDDDRLLAGGLCDKGVRLWDVADGGEVRRTVARKAQNSADFGPDGRLLVFTDHDGIRFWDVRKLQVLTFVPLQGRHSVVVSDSGDRVFVAGTTGVSIWPISVEPDSAGSVLRIGVCRKLPLPENARDLAFHECTDVLAVAYDDHARILRLSESDEPIVCEHPNSGTVSLSADGRSLATATGIGTETGDDTQSSVRIWDTRNGRQIQQLPITGRTRACFNAVGGRLLTVTEAATTIWDANTWKPVRTIDRPASTHSRPLFSPDGRIVALPGRELSHQLLDAGTDTYLGSLGQGSLPVCFSPDGSRLVILSNASLRLWMWDLRRLRQNLTTLNLDWAQPPYPDAENPDHSGRYRAYVVSNRLRVPTGFSHRIRIAGEETPFSELTADSENGVVINIPAEASRHPTFNVNKPITTQPGQSLLLITEGTFEIGATVELPKNAQGSLPPVYCYDSGPNWRFVPSHVEPWGDASRIVLQASRRPLKSGDHVLLKSGKTQTFLSGAAKPPSLAATTVTAEAVWILKKVQSVDDTSSGIKFGDRFCLKNNVSGLYLTDAGGGAGLSDEATDRAEWKLIRTYQSGETPAAGDDVRIQVQATGHHLKARRDVEKASVKSGTGGTSVWRLHHVPAVAGDDEAE